MQLLKNDRTTEIQLVKTFYRMFRFTCASMLTTSVGLPLTIYKTTFDWFEACVGVEIIIYFY